MTSGDENKTSRDSSGNMCPLSKEFSSLYLSVLNSTCSATSNEQPGSSLRLQADEAEKITTAFYQDRSGRAKLMAKLRLYGSHSQTTKQVLSIAKSQLHKTSNEEDTSDVSDEKSLDSEDEEIHAWKHSLVFEWLRLMKNLVFPETCGRHPC